MCSQIVFIAICTCALSVNRPSDKRIELLAADMPSPKARSTYEGSRLDDEHADAVEMASMLKELKISALLSPSKLRLRLLAMR